MTSFLGRIVGAAKLDRDVYEEVEADRSAFGQALAVVALSSAATVVGLTGRFGLSDLASALALGVLAWAVWSAIALVIGGRLWPEPQTQVDWGELLRTTGFATAPGMLSVLGVFPAFQGFITFVASLWILLAFSVAVRQALDYRSTAHAAGVCFVGWVLYAGMLLGLIPR